MSRPMLEMLELRRLLSAGLLAAGQYKAFDFNGDSVNDAVLVNNGTSAIQYTYTSGTGLDSVNITQDGGAFTTNTWVAQVGDTNPTADYALSSAKMGTSVKVKGTTYNPIAGTSNVRAGSVDQVSVGVGNLLEVDATQGGINKVLVNSGLLGNAISAAGIGDIVVSGDVTGTVYAEGGISRVSAGRVYGGAIIANAGDLGKLVADSITNVAFVQAVNVGQITTQVLDAQTTILTSGADHPEGRDDQQRDDPRRHDHGQAPGHHH